uniref:Uncharacterized protein n=1 Tax=Strombidium rassoulzadegani TaxID=1082188 RepID=A0A7S3CMQ3_9SPIT|mmetsp:Transcript_17582/g.29681  ORF Transcript_17582/g.29681 Transcript_17582/m.29681 type:complete len:248 (+) Transcript_17582:11-754(+)
MEGDEPVESDSDMGKVAKFFFELRHSEDEHIIQILDSLALLKDDEFWRIVMTVAFSIDEQDFSLDLVLGILIELVNMYGYTTVYVFDKRPTPLVTIATKFYKIAQFGFGEIDYVEYRNSLLIKNTIRLLVNQEEPDAIEDRGINGLLYDFAVVLIRETVQNGLWSFFYFGPWAFMTSNILYLILLPWFTGSFLLPLSIPIFLFTLMYLGAAKNLLWNYDFAYDQGGFTLVENPYITNNPLWNTQRYE